MRSACFDFHSLATILKNDVESLVLTMKTHYSWYSRMEKQEYSKLDQNKERFENWEHLIFRKQEVGRKQESWGSVEEHVKK